MKTIATISLLFFALTSCREKAHVKVEGVYAPAVVADPEIQIIEKTFPENFTGMVPKYYGEDSTHIDHLMVVQNGEVQTRYFFDRDRHLQQENHYDCQALHGTQKRYYPNGKVKEILEMDHGVRNGQHSLYEINGKLRASETWKDGKPQGLIRVYDSLETFSHLVGREQYNRIFLE